MELLKCQRCNNGILIPLSDYGPEGTSLIFKAWACTNPECGFSLSWAKRDRLRMVSARDRPPAELEDVVQATKDVESAVDDVASAIGSAVEELTSAVEELRDQTEATTRVMTGIVKSVKGGFWVIAVLLLPVAIRACQQLR